MRRTIAVLAACAVAAALSATVTGAAAVPRDTSAACAVNFSLNATTTVGQPFDVPATYNQACETDRASIVVDMAYSRVGDTATYNAFTWQPGQTSLDRAGMTLPGTYHLIPVTVSGATVTESPNLLTITAAPCSVVFGLSQTTAVAGQDLQVTAATTGDCSPAADTATLGLTEDGATGVQQSVAWNKTATQTLTGGAPSAGTWHLVVTPSAGVTATLDASTVAVTAAPTCDATKASVTLALASHKGTTSTLTGTVTGCRADETLGPIRSATVQLYRLYAGKPAYTYVHVTTDTHGHFTFKGVNSYTAQTWSVRSDGIVSGDLHVKQARRAPLLIDLHSSRSGHTVHFHGTVQYQTDWYTAKPFIGQGGLGEITGMHLSLQRQTRGVWKTVETVVTTTAKAHSDTNVRFTASGSTAPWRLTYHGSSIIAPSYGRAITR